MIFRTLRLAPCAPDLIAGPAGELAVRSFLSGLREGIATDWPILAGAGGVWSALILLLAAKGVDGLQVASYADNLLLYMLGLVPMVMWGVGAMLYRARPESPIRFIAALVANGEWARRLARGLPMLLALILFMPAFSAIKSAIARFKPYSWDPTWIAVDQAIHGTDAWRLLQPLLGFPIVTSMLSVAYFAWFFLIYSGSTYFCFLSRDAELRARYFISYFATWTVCGVCLAIGFASVGPCFVGPLLGIHTFDAQMAYLNAANEQYPVMILRAQHFVLDAQLHADHGLGAGISAMPSMHVAMALLFALAIAPVSKLAKIGGFAFFGTIQIATVHLAVHYAVDGYLSIAVTLLLWFVAKPLARWVARGSRFGPTAASAADREPAAA
jgi:hypothetical protein